jgi:manganese/zinc/iron transport system permease protein
VDIVGLVGNLFADYTLRQVAMGAAMLGIVNGVLGSFAVLRKQSLLGDGISHAALPGIALAFLLTGSKSSLALLLGAAAAGWIGTLLIMSIVKHTRVKYDSALGLVLSVFFGFGLVLLTYIQKLPVATQAGLDKFLFGQAATLLRKDVVTIGVLGGIVLVFLLVFWKEFKLISFDPDFAFSLGFPVRILDILLTTLLVIAIVIGLQTVGVVLMSAMVVAPAAAARQWTDRLGVMVTVSGIFGALAGVSGALVSSQAAEPRDGVGLCPGADQPEAAADGCRAERPLCPREPAPGAGARPHDRGPSHHGARSRRRGSKPQGA